MPCCHVLQRLDLYVHIQAFFHRADASALESSIHYNDLASFTFTRKLLLRTKERSGPPYLLISLFWRHKLYLLEMIEESSKNLIREAEVRLQIILSPGRSQVCESFVRLHQLPDAYFLELSLDASTGVRAGGPSFSGLYCTSPPRTRSKNELTPCL
jgi:hypothetical protein